MGSLKGKKNFFSPSMVIYILSITSGGMDVVSFLKFHFVFTSAMTGNIALLGLSIGGGELLLSTHSLSALLGFFLGVYIGSIYFWRKSTASFLLFCEAIILASYSVIWLCYGLHINGFIVYILIILSSVSMGLQSVAARLINIAGIPSVVFTNTITSIIIKAYECMKEGSSYSGELPRQLVALLSYTAGAITFSWLIYSMLSVAVVLPALIIMVASVMMRNIS